MDVRNGSNPAVSVWILTHDLRQFPRQKAVHVGHQRLTSVPLLGAPRGTGPGPARSPSGESRQHG